MELILATVNHQFSRAYFDVVWFEKDVHFIQNHQYSSGLIVMKL